MQDEVGSESEYSNFSQDVFDIDETKLDSAGPSTSSLSLNMDTNVSPGEDAHETTMPRTPVQTGDDDDDAWTDVEKRQKIPSGKKLREKRGGKMKLKKPVFCNNLYLLQKTIHDNNIYLLTRKTKHQLQGFAHNTFFTWI